jgi:hypothetical protein
MVPLIVASSTRASFCRTPAPPLNPDQTNQQAPGRLTHPPTFADGTNRRRQLPRAQMNFHFRASCNAPVGER